jgi:hypothetical protein
MAFWSGEVYAIATEGRTGRLFKASLKDGCGFSEIVLRDNEGEYNPVSLSVMGDGIHAVYERKGNISFWLIDGKYDDLFDPLDLESAVDYHASFAKSSPRGWIEHWDTAAYGILPLGSGIGTQDVCDGLLYEPRYYSLNSPNPRGDVYDDTGTDGEWNYIIPAGKFAWKRPIGKTIKIRIFAELDNALVAMYKKAEKYALQQVALTTVRQDEVLNPNYNPNRTPREPYITTEHNSMIKED